MGRSEGGLAHDVLWDTKERLQASWGKKESNPQVQAEGEEEENPKTQVPTPNLGHPPRYLVRRCGRVCKHDPPKPVKKENAGIRATRLHKLKLRVARKLWKRRRWGFAGQLRLPFPEHREPLRAFWQARFYDFNVYTKGKKAEKLNYMHANPVLRGLVKHPQDWPWSSWGFYWRGAAGPVVIDVEE